MRVSKGVGLMLLLAGCGSSCAANATHVPQTSATPATMSVAKPATMSEADWKALLYIVDQVCQPRLHVEVQLKYDVLKKNVSDQDLLRQLLIQRCPGKAKGLH